jgi:hypothetical protein
MSIGGVVCYSPEECTCPDCAMASLELELSSKVSARDLTIRDLRAELSSEREWRERVRTLLSDCYAELDPVFEERLMRRIDEELHAANLLPVVKKP